MKRGKDFTPIERDAIISRAREVGVSKAAQEAGITYRVVTGWLAYFNRQPTVKIIPGSNGLPRKKDDTNAYSMEERRLLVEKADEVGNANVRLAYGLKSNNLHDWRIMLVQQAKKIERNPSKIEMENDKMENAAILKNASEPITQNNPLASGSHTMPYTPIVASEEPVLTAGKYSLEVEVILLREKVATLTKQIEMLSEMLRTALGTLVP